MVRLGLVALLLATGVSACATAGGEPAADDEYGVRRWCDYALGRGDDAAGEAFD